jgi:predicted transcriptional regulator
MSVGDYIEPESVSLMMIRRSKIEVFADVMKVVASEREIRRTRIMYKANLAWKVLKEALDFLEGKGIIQTVAKESGIFVSLTNEGYGVLQRFNELEEVFTKPMVIQAQQEAPVFASARVSVFA